MPELPEVETIRKGIKRKLIGKKIAEVEIKVPKMFSGNPTDIIGAKIIDAKRIAKILEIDLDNDLSIIIHLKLTGQLIYVPVASGKGQGASYRGGHFQRIYHQPPPNPFTYITYTFSDGSHLYYNDFRKFGWHKLVKTDQVLQLIGEVGPEPMTKEFTVEYLKKIFQKTSKPVKIVLMDQTKIAGLGNIYANDALYDAGILPNRPAKSLKDEEINKLKSTIENVLKLGLEYGGSSENTYVNIEGKKGQYMTVARVYQKTKDPKGHLIKKVQLGGRGTFYCNICQH